MTDLNLATSPMTSALSGFLTSREPHAEVSVYHGVVTPNALDVQFAEIEAVTSGAAVHDLGWLRRVQLRGEDRFRWLSGMVTNAVKELAPNAGAWNLVLNAQGRIQGDLTVWREPPQGQGPAAGDPGPDNDELELELAADQYDRLLAHLDRFIIMDDVELVPSDGETAIGLTGPRAAEVLGRVGLPILEPMTQTRTQWKGKDIILRRGYGKLADHYAIWISVPEAEELWQGLVDAGARPAGSAAVEALRIAEGIPSYGIDIAERDLPQETSQMRALHFNKGCYLGQEIVERIRSRGNVHRHLRSLELEGPVPAPGTKLTLDGAEAGHITSAIELPLSSGTRVFALGMIRSEAELPNLLLIYTAGEATGAARILAG
jgi:folate-binding protein YgfZ